MSFPLTQTTSQRQSAPQHWSIHCSNAAQPTLLRKISFQTGTLCFKLHDKSFQHEPTLESHASSPTRFNNLQVVNDKRRDLFSAGNHQLQVVPRTRRRLKYA